MYENHAVRTTHPQAEPPVGLDVDPDIQRGIELAYSSAETLQLLRAKRDRLNAVIADIEKRLASAADPGPQPANRG